MTTIQSKAILRHAKVSAQKARLVADLVRNMAVPDAVELLSFTQKKSAPLMLKLIKSATANAEHEAGRAQSNVDVDNLYVSEIFVDKGPQLKRFRPRAQGRAGKILKQTSHITVVLGTR